MFPSGGFPVSVTYRNVWGDVVQKELWANSNGIVTIPMDVGIGSTFTLQSMIHTRLVPFPPLKLNDVRIERLNKLKESRPYLAKKQTDLISADKEKKKPSQFLLGLTKRVNK